MDMGQLQHATSSSSGSGSHGRGTRCSVVCGVLLPADFFAAVIPVLVVQLDSEPTYSYETASGFYLHCEDPRCRKLKI
uniref:Uncharacterized protein n=1 Tax=Zea mays TaxID=4577 RepID=A0A804N4Q1_MAIZE